MIKFFLLVFDKHSENEKYIFYWYAAIDQPEVTFMKKVQLRS